MASGLIGTSGYNALVLASIVSCVLFPSLFRPIEKSALKDLAQEKAH